MTMKIAVVGATSQVGREILQILPERKFPAQSIVALGSEKSIGSIVSYGEDSELTVQDVARFDFKGTSIVFFAGKPETSLQYAPKAANAGAKVIDMTSAFRLNPDVPLIVPEVNGLTLGQQTKLSIIASPGPLCIQAALTLKPLHDAAQAIRVVVSTYQAVSNLGKQAMDELFTQTRGVYVNDVPQKEHFTKQIAFNVIPHVDAFMEDGQTKEEWGLMAELKKVLDPSVKITATCVHVPVFIGHAMALNAEFKNALDTAEARRLLKKAPGVSIVDKRSDEGYVTPVEAAGDDLIFVSRIRDDMTVENGLNMWIVGDNIRKGAALNAVQIAELLIPRLKAH